MNTPDNNQSTSSDAPGQTKEVEIFVNSRSKTVTGRKYPTRTS